MKPDQDASELLDYTERDDQLVGFAWGFAKVNPELSVRILTPELGPVASAEMVKLELSDFPNLIDFQKRVAERPAVQAALKAEGLVE